MFERKHGYYFFIFLILFFNFILWEDVKSKSISIDISDFEFDPKCLISGGLKSKGFESKKNNLANDKRSSVDDYGAIKSKKSSDYAGDDYEYDPNDFKSSSVENEEDRDLNEFVDNFSYVEFEKEKGRIEKGRNRNDDDFVDVSSCSSSEDFNVKKKKVVEG